MSDTTEYLLTQFYGIGKKNNPIIEPLHHEVQFYQDKSSYDSTSFARNTISATEESCTQQSLETNLADNSEENDCKVSTSRSWRAIENDEELNIEESGSKDEDLLSDEQKIEELHDFNTRSFLPVKSTLPVVLDGRHDSPRARPSVTTIEDTYLDTLSDVSSRSTKKKGKKSSFVRESKITLPAIMRPSPAPSSLKAPVYNKLYCDMSNALIQTLSVDIFENFHDIRMLYLENNNLQELPDGLFIRLQSLQWLDVRNNQLKTLPSTIKNHKCLETILLQGNQIERLPLELCLIPNLKSIHLAYNPLIFPSVEVRSLGFKAMMDCLRDEWNKKYPDEIVTPPKGIQSVMTVSCQEPSKKFKRFKFSEYSRKSSNTKDNMSVRERSRNYKPSNRCQNFGDNKMHEEKFSKMCRLRENLIKQNKILQKIHDKNVLKKWRQDRRSVEKSMKKAAERNQIQIPYDTYDSEHKSHDSIKPIFIPDINNQMSNIVESLRHFHIQTNKEPFNSIIQRNRLESDIKKLKSLKKEIVDLKHQNEKSLILYETNQSVECKKYKSSPSIII